MLKYYIERDEMYVAPTYNNNSHAFIHKTIVYEKKRIMSSKILIDIKR